MSLITKIILICSGLMILGALVFTSACPCGPMPGAWLFGNAVTEPIDDWSFANEVPLCQVQVTNWRPHSVNLNCMSADGELYISCSNCAAKSWSNTAVETKTGRIRMGDDVYSVRLRRLTDNAQLDIAWQARLAKIKRDKSMPRPDHWWSFQLTSP